MCTTAPTSLSHPQFEFSRHKNQNSPLPRGPKIATASGIVRFAVATGLVTKLPKWQAIRMPDYSLFGDEHVRQYEATGGKTGHDWNNTSCLVLHTIGRKSGETKKFPLIYGRDGNNYLIVASKGGAPDHPGWYKNLLAHPDVKIQVWDKVIPVRARTATAEEKKRVWPIMVAEWPDYDTYQGGTKRDIPVVILTPR